MQRASLQTQRENQTEIALDRSRAQPDLPHEGRTAAGYWGNQAALRRLTQIAPRVQCKLEIGAVDDPLEAEADRVADEAMQASSFSVSVGSQFLHRKCGACEREEDEEKKLRMKSDGEAEAAGQAPAGVHEVLREPGEPLDTPTREFFEPRFDADFSQVRIHADTRAAATARDVNALAYAAGSHIVLGPKAEKGPSQLMAHELAHVVQQNGGDGRLQRADDPYAKLTIAQLRKRMASDPEAVWALRNRYRQMPTSDLQRYKDDVAASVLAQRNITPADSAGQGTFSNPAVRQMLEADIKQERAASGIVRQSSNAVQPDLESEGGTVGSARTDIPGLENSAFVGRSPRAGGQVNPNSKFTPATDPNTLPQTHAHAEQGIADQIEAALSGIPPEKLKGRRIWMLIEQEPCSTCAQGISDPNIAAGVLRKLSQKYPDLTFEIKNLDSSAVIVLKGNTNTPAAGGGTTAEPATAPKDEPAPSASVPPKQTASQMETQPANTTPAEPTAPVKPPAPASPAVEPESPAPAAPQQAPPSKPPVNEPQTTEPAPSATLPKGSGKAVAKGFGKAAVMMGVQLALTSAVKESQRRELLETIAKAKRFVLSQVEDLKSRNPNQPVYLRLTIRESSFSQYLPLYGWVPAEDKIDLWEFHVTTQKIDQPELSVEDHSLDLLRPGEITYTTYTEPVDLPASAPSLAAHPELRAILGLASDDAIRAWIGAHDDAVIALIATGEKMRLINRLLDGWVSSADLNAIEKIVKSATPAELSTISAAVSPRIGTLSDIGQRTRLRAILP